MQKYNDQIQIQLDSLLVSSKEINKLLLSDKEEDQTKIAKKIRQKYLYRKETIDNIRNILGGEEKVNAFFEKDSDFSKVIKEITDIDTINVGLLKTAKDEVKFTLSNINKSKKVLIYSKGAVNEY